MTGRERQQREILRMSSGQIADKLEAALARVRELEAELGKLRAEAAARDARIAKWEAFGSEFDDWIDRNDLDDDEGKNLGWAPRMQLEEVIRLLLEAMTCRNEAAGRGGDGGNDQLWKRG